MEPKDSKTKNPHKSISAAFKSFRFSLGADADVDWKILSLVFFILSVLSAVFNVFFFTRFVILAQKGKEKTAEVELINRDKLLEIIKVYKERGDRFDEIMKAKTEPIDPKPAADIVLP